MMIHGDGTRSPSSSVLANAGALLASRLTIAALGWIGTVVIVRALSADEYGRFTFVFSVLGILSIITEMGIGRVALTGILDESRDRERFAGSYVVLRCLLGVVGYLVGLGAVAAVGYPSDVVQATAVAGLVVVIATPASAYITVFEAHRRMRGVAVADAVARVAQLALIAAIAAGGGRSLLLFTLPAVLAQLIVLASVAPMAHRLMSFRYAVDIQAWWALLREAAPLTVGGALATIYYRVDSIMLSILDGFTAVGAYGVAYKFVDLANFVSNAVTMSLLPLLVVLRPKGQNSFRAGVRRGAVILALAAGWIVVEFTLFAEPAIRLLYGEPYVAAADASRLVVVSQCLTYFTSLALITLVAAGQHQRYPLIALAGLLINIGLNLVLIPRFSYEGAAAATLITDVIVLIWMIWVVRRITGMRPLPRPPILRLVAALAVSAAPGWVLSHLVPWPVAALLVTCIYLLAILVLRAAGPAGLRALLHDTQAQRLSAGAEGPK